MFSRQIDAIVIYPNNYLNISKRALRGKLIKKTCWKREIEVIIITALASANRIQVLLTLNKVWRLKSDFQSVIRSGRTSLGEKNNKLISPSSFQCKQRECWNRDWPLDETKGIMNGHLIKGFFVDLTKVATYQSRWTTYLSPKLS